MQTSSVVTQHATTESPAGTPSRYSRYLGLAILVLLGVLIAEVFLEGWLVVRLGVHGTGAAGEPTFDPANWPKTLKSGLYFLLFGLTAAKLTVDRAWSSLRTKADVALVVLAGIMVVAGLLGGSSTVLIGQALFVYFRGVIVFYAFRALKPSWDQIKPLLWLGGGLLMLNAVLALVQFLAGSPGYTMLGWVNLQWADEGRAQGLLDHPNDLGHLVAFALVGLVAWFVSAEKVKRRWWVLFGFLAVILAIAQSRQSTVALLGAIVILAVLRRGRYKRFIAATVVVIAASVLPVGVSPESRAQLSYRLGGLFNSFNMSGGKDSKKQCVNNPACVGQDGEIRVLFAKQGAKLWAENPLLGYGVGQFGGIVAVKNDPQWNQDPRFQEVLGPDGFFLHGFKSTSVDVFWLHLLVEVGAVGVLAYVAWMFLIGLPLFMGARHRASANRLRGSPRSAVIVLWAAAGLVFAGLIATWSPSLEDPLFPPLMFAVAGFGWVLLGGRADATAAVEGDRADAAAGDDDRADAHGGGR